MSRRDYDAEYEACLDNIVKLVTAFQAGRITEGRLITKLHLYTTEALDIRADELDDEDEIDELDFTA